MKTKTKIISAAIVFSTIALGISVSVAGTPSMLSPCQTDDDKFIAESERAERTVECQKILSSPEYIAASQSESNARIAEHLRQVEEQKRIGRLDPSPVSPSELGIFEGGPTPEQGFWAVNSWLGYDPEHPDDHYVTVQVSAGSYKNRDPMQGVLEVKVERRSASFQEVSNTSFQTTYSKHNSPTATGPLRITKIDGDVLTLISVAGEYEVYDINTDIRKTVTTPGGVTYRFDIRTRTWF